MVALLGRDRDQVGVLDAVAVDDLRVLLEFLAADAIEPFVLA